MARRKPARPKTQQRHRTKATTGIVARPKRTTDETGTDDVEFFIIAGKRYRWMRSESGAMTAVLAPLEKPRLMRGANGRTTFLARDGRVVDLTGAISESSFSGEPPTRVEYPDAAAARADGASPAVVKQAAEYDSLVRKAMERTGQTRAEVLAAFNVVEPIR